MTTVHPDSVPSLLFLGTGAADWPYHPEPNWTGRALSSALLDGHILLDCGPATPDALTRYGVDPRALTDLLITHTHDDHLDPEALQQLLTARAGEPPLRVWADPGALPRVPRGEALTLHAVAAGEQATLGRWLAEPLPANHVGVGPFEQPVHWLLASPATTLYYATDGAWITARAWGRLQRVTLDMLVWDATIGDVVGDSRIFEHNSLAMIRLMATTLRTQGVLTERSRVLLTHLARTLHPDQQGVEASVAPDGFLVAYDGLRLPLV